jgi:O-antigen biosynthesis protein
MSLSVPVQPSWQPIAVRTLDLTQPLKPLCDLENYAGVRVFPTWQDIPIGWFEVTHNFQAEVSSDRLAMELAKLQWTQPTPLPQLGQQVAVSIVIATCDRPDSLGRCLQALCSQVTARDVEIIVVDNRPRSGLTPPVLEAFPQVKYVAEARAGVSYARNAGILVSAGEIIVTVDDDVVIPAQWLEHLLAPFARSEVWAVTGNILPLELDTQSQQVFEVYGDGGLGRGFRRFEADRRWFDRSWPVVRTWLLGATANSAFRALIFQHPEIGLMDEALGPGMPSGVGEDIYLFYKILKARGVIVYEPAAYVWHQHRRQMSELQHQIYSYSKGIVAYHLTTLFKDGDYRALWTMAMFLPLYHLKRSLLWMLGDRRYPLSLTGWEIWGNLMGSWALWRSRQRVKQLGRSQVEVSSRFS